MKYLTAIVLAAGKGLRFRSQIPKTLVKINSKPLIIYSLEALSRHPSVKEIIIVVNAGNKKDIVSKIKRYRIKKISRVVEGGKRRQDSVQSGLRAMDSRTDSVLIHDGVRPFIDKKILTQVVKAGQDYGAAIVGVPVKATIKAVHSPQSPPTPRLRRAGIVHSIFVEETLKRNNLWEIQTPQVFRKGLILEAYKKFGDLEVTDDAMLVERLGRRVCVVPGSYSNIKITTPEDLVLAEAIAKNIG
jgi:2-C-methyl-D-erythritol 4-phosphate cytidylyltransferase